MNRADLKELEVEREHTRYENALLEIEQLADDGVAALSPTEKTAMLVEIRDRVQEVL